MQEYQRHIGSLQKKVEKQEDAQATMLSDSAEFRGTLQSMYVLYMLCIHSCFLLEA